MPADSAISQSDVVALTTYRIRTYHGTYWHVTNEGMVQHLPWRDNDAGFDFFIEVSRRGESDWVAFRTYRREYLGIARQSDIEVRPGSADWTAPQLGCLFAERVANFEARLFFWCAYVVYPERIAGPTSARDNGDLRWNWDRAEAWEMFSVERSLTSSGMVYARDVPDAR